MEFRDQFRFVRDLNTLKDYDLDESPVRGGIHYAARDVVVEPANLGTFHAMLREGVAVDGTLIVKGPLLMDDGTTLSADNVVCESAVLFECYCDIGRLMASKLVALHASASQGYLVELALETQLFIYDSAALGSGTVILHEKQFQFSMDTQEHEVDIARVIHRDTDGLLAAATAGVLEKYLSEFAA
ncbi:MAG: hypothetical protein AAFX94_21035 [Myxococcota bacterium]